MSDLRTIEGDPSWIPHRLDVQGRSVEFIRVSRAKLADRGFLADRDPPASDRAVLGWDAVQSMAPAKGTMHLIVHSAFCRSTLLVRALDAPGIVTPFNEPGIVASLVNAGEAGRAMIAPVMALLSRPHAHGEAVVLKPTNHANMIVPEILRHLPDARVLLMTNALPGFLRSVARRGLMGRNWGRKLFLELQSYAGMDFGMDPRASFAMTDLQASGLAWFLNQRFFTLLASGSLPGIARERFAVLDSDRFDAQREATISALFAHFSINAPGDLSASLALSPVFDQHAKLGGNFAPEDEKRLDTVCEEEIGQVAQWVDLIAQQTGINAPVAHTLF